MLDQFVRDPELVRQLRSGALGGVLEAFVSDMLARGHTARIITDYVREAGRLAEWMDLNRRMVNTLNRPVLEEFLASGGSVTPSGRPRRKARGALRRLLATLETRGIVAPASPSAISPVDVFVRQFLDHSTRCRGLCSATCEQQGRLVREFLTARFPDGAVDVGVITAGDLMTYVSARAETGQSRTAKCVGTALRAFLRFLSLQGMCAAELVGAVPAAAHRCARLPRALSADQIQRLLSGFDRSQPVGCRDYAIALCLVRLGLRGSEVVGLRLDDIAWRDGTIRLGTGKSRRATTMPLPADVGLAISQYIQDVRPPTTARHVFVSHVVPVGTPLTAAAARGAMRRAFDRAALQVVSKGTHSLRHTLATRMVCEGSSLKEVADVLRHRSLDTTVVYARVDLPNLRSVAMPWPAVRS